MMGGNTVALVGFSEHESSLIESFLRRSARRSPAYRVQDRVIDAQLLVVNADSVQALHLVRQAKLPARVLLLGSHDGGTGWLLQRKPVKPMGLLALLDSLLYAGQKAPARPHTGVASVQAAAESLSRSPSKSLDLPLRAVREGQVPAVMPLAPTQPVRPRFTASGFNPIRPTQGPGMRRALVWPPVAVVFPTAPAAPHNPSALTLAALRHPGVLRPSDLGDLDAQPLPLVSAPPSRMGRALRPILSPPGSGMAGLPDEPRGDLLLVADSMVEGRLLYKRFQRHGWLIDWSQDASQAQEMLKVHAYRLVVIDRLHRAADAYQLCRSAKQGASPHGTTPFVVMLAPTAGSMDRMKALLAGCDAYLPRTVDEVDVRNLLAQQRVPNPGPSRRPAWGPDVPLC